ncbi:MAG: GntR family transcriptional regulator [Myxococcota bacterium]|jgi:GntR family transcriptional regulator, transcriptional repressor for pyruvate dehydrogenase complex|nr:GntR family transcriptional regulator [Myxococcota bacterium]
MTNRTPFKSVQRRAIYVEVADQIRTAILERSLTSGERLPPERELAEQFGVSRATVREALRYLEAQGLLAAHGRTSPKQAAKAEAQIGRFCEALTNVVQLQDVSLSDLNELRFAIETAALTRAAAAPVAAQLDEARAAVALMAREDVSPAEFYEADVRLHIALVAASGNRALHLVMLAVKSSIRSRIDEAVATRSFETLRPKLVAEHRALLRAVERGNAKSAVALLREHLSFYAT